jgi:shikimate kinase
MASLVVYWRHRCRYRDPDSTILSGAMKGAPIWLVGMMGAGKSAIGPLLAQQLGRRFVDTDAEIERSMERSIADIFERDGESAFRTCEREVIESLCQGDDVVALGGGAIAQPGATELLGRSGTVVYVRASIPTLIQRLGDCAARPLLRDLDGTARAVRLNELLENRQAAYLSADHVVDTDGLAVGSVVDEIARRLAAAAGPQGTAA